MSFAGIAFHSDFTFGLDRGPRSVRVTADRGPRLVRVTADRVPRLVRLTADRVPRLVRVTADRGPRNGAISWTADRARTAIFDGHPHWARSAVKHQRKIAIKSDAGKRHVSKSPKLSSRGDGKSVFAEARDQQEVTKRVPRGFKGTPQSSKRLPRDHRIPRDSKKAPKGSQGIM